MRFRDALSLRSAPALAALLALVAAPAQAHEATYQVERGRAIALQALEDGEGMAEARWQVYSPAAPGRPHQEGRTDRLGWLAFVPDAPGKWRVRVIEEDGHGLDVEIDAGAQATVPVSAASGAGSTWLRGLLGLAAIGGAFAALYLTYRRRDRAPGA